MNIVINKDRTVDVLLALTAILMWAFGAWHIDIGFKTVADDSWYIFGLEQTYPYGNMSTESYRMLRFLLNYIPGNLITYRLLSYFTVFLSVVVLSVASYTWFRKKKILTISVIQFFSLFFLLGSLMLFSRLYASPIHYNQLQTFFVFSCFSAYLFADVTEGVKNKLSGVAMGFFMVLSVLNIPPSGAFISLALVILLIIKHYKHRNICISSITFVFFGVLLSLLVYHFLIREIPEVYNSFKKVAVSTTTVIPEKTGRGHNIPYFGYLIKDYFRDFTFIILFSSILVLFLNMYTTKVKPYLLLILLSVILLIFSIVGRRSFQGNVFLIPIVLGFLFNISRITDYFSKKYLLLFLMFSILLIFDMSISFKILSFYILLAIVVSVFLWKFSPEEKVTHKFSFYDICFVLFILLIPCIASLGTDIGIDHKVYFFLPVWAILFCLSFLDKKKTSQHIMLIFFLSMILSVFAFNYLDKRVFSGSFWDSKETTYLENLKKVKIRKKQKECLERVDQLLKQNGFQKGDAIFAFHTNQGFVYGVSGKLPGGFGTFYRTDRFLTKDRLELTQPEYAILSEEEMEDLSNYFKLRNWNFSEDYFRYEISHPDLNIPISLYCLKPNNN